MEYFEWRVPASIIIYRLNLHVYIINTIETPPCLQSNGALSKNIGLIELFIFTFVRIGRWKTAGKLFLLQHTT